MGAVAERTFGPPARRARFRRIGRFGYPSRGPAPYVGTRLAAW
jgi:hypothetical protein